MRGRRISGSLSTTAPSTVAGSSQQPAIRQKMLTRAGNGSRTAAIRLNCLDCCCGSAAEVRRCHLTDCALHPYRMGVYRRETVEHDDARQVPSSGSDGAT
jgi:hypothetical protein